MLSAYSHFQLLCTLRKGPWGVEKSQNLSIAKTLRSEKLLYGSDVTLEEKAGMKAARYSSPKTTTA
ncbi:exodeoxyribonuclease V alpha subunit [Aidingimonas halophila]|uniref:Exodeoxyribonuclease V alpha subunit n=1 Tax=Aidingimonas halophila TaxID=574349 RepID=A0A1H3A1P0_9GAMM|nr:hypothetical protein GCM10008094_10080 [Aidingimonas halophila]SDX23607.1 exodeoxyribonuclease V alpha subunit [Aidingimonas halophila]